MKPPRYLGVFIAAVSGQVMSHDFGWMGQVIAFALLFVAVTIVEFGRDGCVH